MVVWVIGDGEFRKEVVSKLLLFFYDVSDSKFALHFTNFFYKSLIQYLFCLTVILVLILDPIVSSHW